MTRRGRDQHGSAPVVELALGAPLILVVVWLVIWAGSGTQAPAEVDLAAHDAARLASTLRAATERPAAAADLVDSRLDGGTCSDWTTATTSTAASVTVTVTCVLDTPQMAGLNVPTRTVTAIGRASLDRFFVTEP